MTICHKNPPGKLTAPIARPLFAWNHDRLMDAGGRGLATLLGVRRVG